MGDRAKIPEWMTEDQDADRCVIADIFKVADEPSREDTGSLQEYLSNFLKPDGGNCRCGLQLTGLLGTFEWGIAHGEGRCGACGRWFRLYHKLTAADGTRRGVLTFPLQYPPLPLAELGSSDG